MMGETHAKVKVTHLKRDAYLYVRQSTVRQVFENTESTKRQYALKQRAIALGWPLERVQVIDTDLGQSGASAADREGFKRLITEVSLGRVGVVLGLEVSRLARNCTDWTMTNKNGFVWILMHRCVRPSRYCSTRFGVWGQPTQQSDILTGTDCFSLAG